MLPLTQAALSTKPEVACVCLHQILVNTLCYTWLFFFFSENSLVAKLLGGRVAEKMLLLK